MALVAYRSYLEAKGTKPRSREEAYRRIKTFFQDDLMSPLESLSRQACESRYLGLAKIYKADTHRNMLIEARSLFRWCVKKSWLRQNPLEGIEGLGVRKRGKEQLRLNEARKWKAKAFDLAWQGEAGAIAALLTLYLNLRASEIVSARVRDVDGDGRLLWIPDSKTEAGRRMLQIPDPIRPLLLALTYNRPADAELFGHHWRDWPREWVQKICKLSHVPVVTAHGMRGLHATLAAEAGITGHLIAQAMGHTSDKVTFAHYAKPGSGDRARTERVLKVLEGGRK